jgi:hypothetical protein
VDRGVPDFIGSVSGDIAVHVDNCGGAVGRDVAVGGTGLFFLPFDSDYGCGNALRPVEVIARQG